jgi:hypothetical protein
MFALGTIVYRAITGDNAFPARTAAAAVYEAVHVHPTPPTRVDPSLPPDLDVVLALALAKQPEQRYVTRAHARPGCRVRWGLPEASRDRAAAIIGGARRTASSRRSRSAWSRYTPRRSCAPAGQGHECCALWRRRRFTRHSC